MVAKTAWTISRRSVKLETMLKFFKDSRFRMRMIYRFQVETYEHVLKVS